MEPPRRPHFILKCPPPVHVDFCGQGTHSPAVPDSRLLAQPRASVSPEYDNPQTPKRRRGAGPGPQHQPQLQIPPRSWCKCPAQWAHPREPSWPQMAPGQTRRARSATQQTRAEPQLNTGHGDALQGHRRDGSWCPLARPESYPGVLDWVPGRGGAPGEGGTEEKAPACFEGNERQPPWDRPTRPESEGLEASTAACGPDGNHARGVGVWGHFGGGPRRARRPQQAEPRRGADRGLRVSLGGRRDTFPSAAASR